jgi:hypothetical protein
MGWFFTIMRYAKHNMFNAIDNNLFGWETIDVRLPADVWLDARKDDKK